MLEGRRLLSLTGGLLQVPIGTVESLVGAAVPAIIAAPPAHAADAAAVDSSLDIHVNLAPGSLGLGAAVQEAGDTDRVASAAVHNLLGLASPGSGPSTELSAGPGVDLAVGQAVRVTVQASTAFSTRDEQLLNTKTSLAVATTESRPLPDGDGVKAVVDVSVATPIETAVSTTVHVTSHPVVEAHAHTTVRTSKSQVTAGGDAKASADESPTVVSGPVEETVSVSLGVPLGTAGSPSVSVSAKVAEGADSAVEAAIVLPPIGSSGHTVNPNTNEAPPQPGSGAVALAVRDSVFVGTNPLGAGSLAAREDNADLVRLFLAGGGKATTENGTAAEDGSNGPVLLAVPETQSGGGAAMEDEDGLTPQASDLIANFAPFTSAALEQDVQQFLTQLDRMGGGVNNLLAGLGLPSWYVAVVAAGAVACEVARRQLRHPARLALVARGDAASWTGFPGFGSPSTQEGP